jgi:hypothetical protein
MSLGVFAIIFLISLINNWFVQLGYFLYARLKNPESFKGHKTLLDYWTGVVGDGVIAPLVNIFIYIVIVKTGIEITLPLVMCAYLGALALDVLIHWFQGSQFMTNWSMQAPFRWNGAGKWHMFSFPIQVAYLLIYIYTLIMYSNYILHDPSLIVTVAETVVLSLLFLFFFWVDYRK